MKRFAIALTLVAVFLGASVASALPENWKSMTHEQKVQWLENNPEAMKALKARLGREWKNFKAMPETEQARLKRLHARWNKLDDARKKELLARYQVFRRKPAIERQALLQSAKRFRQQRKARRVKLRKRMRRVRRLMRTRAGRKKLRDAMGDRAYRKFRKRFERRNKRRKNRRRR